MNNQVSVVIPTRNRSESLNKVLSCLAEQTYVIEEVIIIDASDNKQNEQNLFERFPSLNIRYFVAEPSVCAQRNEGIQKVNSRYVFLCDDDIEFSKDFMSHLMNYVNDNKVNAVSGLILQKVNGEWVYQYQPKSFTSLLFAFIFQHSVWGQVDQLKVNWFLKTFYNLMKRFYKRKGNTMTNAGRPLITDWSMPSFQTSFYGLGAGIISKEWLINSPFDEVLDAHGIGDNYGVALHFPEERAIHVITNAKVYHHQSIDNRLTDPIAYYRRQLALHYFLKRSSKRKMWFYWSLLGNAIFHKSVDHRKATRVVLKKIITSRNPYWLAYKNGKTGTEPSF